MTTQEKLIQRKLSVLDLAEYLQNVSQACRVMGVSRQHFYDIKQAVAEGGLEALREKSRRKPNLRNRTAPATEEAVLAIALEEAALGQVRVANELRKRGVVLSAAGVRCVWQRHGLETFKKRRRSARGHGPGGRDLGQGAPGLGQGARGLGQGARGLG